LLLAQIKENSPFERSTPWGGDEAAKLAYLACLLFALGCAARATSKGVRMTVAVNLSMANLLDLDLVDTIDRLLTAHRVPPEQLILEITEGALRQRLVPLAQDRVRTAPPRRADLAR
jgi:EAL domain-containing protein (putative c-di-GMP-specific phosphodiesterase class I)